jgi:hypothetical protein
LPLDPGMKFAFKIKTEPVTQAAIIVAIIAFSGSLATITIYANSPMVSTFCMVILAIIIYLVLHFVPC